MTDIQSSNDTGNQTENPHAHLQSRRFSWRTIVIPLVFLAIHFLLANLVALGYVLIAAVIESARTGQDLIALLADQDVLNRLLQSNYPIVATIIGAAIIPICLVYLNLADRRDSRVWLTEKPRLTHVLPALAMTIGSLGLINFWFGFLDAIQDHVPIIRTWMEEYIESAAAFSADSGYFWLILGICIVTPVLEELVFRGVIQGELRKAMPEWVAIVIQAVVFAAYHMQPIQSSYVLLPGLLLGIAYAWSRSIWIPILMHCLFNFLGGVLPIALAGNESAMQGVAIAQAGFILVGIAAAIYFYYNRRKQSNVLI